MGNTYKQLNFIVVQHRFSARSKACCC